MCGRKLEIYHKYLSLLNGTMVHWVLQGLKGGLDLEQFGSPSKIDSSDSNDTLSSSNLIGFFILMLYFYVCQPSCY